MTDVVLCDPALLMPPPPDERGAAQFWARLVEWSSDHRVRLGPASHELVISLLGKFGWPERKTGSYPPGMAQLAYRTLATMLGQALAAEKIDNVPTLSPRYVPGDEGEAAIGSDAASLHQTPLLGLATAEEHWEEVSDRIAFCPPPPELLHLLFHPGAKVDTERDNAVRALLGEKRITIVGGIYNDRLHDELMQQFQPKAIRWLPAERGTRLNLDALDGLQARSDIVYCVTGHIAHAGSTKAQQRCRKRGVEMRKVPNAGDIPEDLRRRYGESK